MLAISDSTIWAVTSDGIFNSNDNGANWVSKGLTDSNVSSVVIKGSNIFVGTEIGVFRSIDNGTNWSLVNSGLTQTMVSCLAMSGTNLFAGTASGGVFLSIDYGANWIEVNTDGLANSAIFSVAAICTDLFAGAEGLWSRALAEFPKSGQTIDFDPITAKAFGHPPFNLSAIVSSCLTVFYTSSDPSVASVSGTTVTILRPGITTITASQVGDDTFEKAEDVQRLLTVNKAIPSITWANPADIIYGIILDSTQLNATSSVEGSLAYIPASGTKLSAGSNQNLSVTFTPTDGANYESVTKQVTINVSKANPTISWSNPADVIYGTALSATQLNASSSVDGSFVYTPASGTKLNAGNNQNLLVTFTPTDGANYNSVTKQVTINVSKAQQQITFPTLADKAIGDGAFNLTGSSNSLLPVSFASTSDKISIANNQVTLLKAGRVSITASQAGNSNYNAAESVTQAFCIKPAKPTITLNDLNTPTPLLTSSASDGNQWYVDGTAIAGATNSTFNAAKSGSYKVQATIDDCIGEFSSDQPLLITGTEAVQASIDLYPNPVGDVLTIFFGDVAGTKQITVFALTGERLLTNNTESSSVTIDVSNLSTGIYLTKILVDGAVQTKKFKK